MARREHPELFTGYTPLTADGPAAEHVVAFDRGGAVAVATRLPIGLAARGGWGETRLRVPAGTWREQLTGRRVTVDERGVALAELLADYPVALLLREVARAGIGGAERGRFDVWAPSAGAVGLAVSAVGQAVGDRLLPMARSSPGDDWDGWWVPAGPEPLGEVDYGYVLDPPADGTGAVLPDPRSHRQPSGVHAPSRTFDPGAFDWTDQAWTGRQLAGSVVYELHVGTFTPRGTLDSAIDRLDHLAQLGVNLVELMPVNAFDGPHGWGYDGVAWFAVHEPYGGPAAYQRFVDACHRAGIGVIQDVVYNHLGPSGNYLPEFGPYLASGGSNPWGAHVNLDGAGSEQVRAFILDNVRMWFEDYHVDGLRLDAVHALADRSDRHLLEDIARSAARSSAHLGRPCTVIAESELNDPHLITSREGGGYGLDGQWNDDFHHALHVALTGQTDGHYADFVSLSALAKACERGFVLDGTWSTFRERMHGKPIDTERLPGWRLVVCAQNHDQVGNRAAGDRLAESLDDDQLACAVLLTLTTPFTPLLFQGEEWATTAPFPFFTSYSDPELGQAVTQGRLRDFAWMGWDPATVPDPQDPATFQRAKLDWAQLASGRHAVLLRVHRELIALRRRHPDLSDPDLTRTRCRVDEERRTFLMDRGPLLVAVNFSPEPVAVDLGGGHELLWATPAGARLDGDRAMLPGHAGALLARLVE